MLDMILTIFYRIDILQICFLFNINFMQTLLSTLDFVLNWNFLLHIYVVMVNNSDAQQNTRFTFPWQFSIKYPNVFRFLI